MAKVLDDMRMVGPLHVPKLLLHHLLGLCVRDLKVLAELHSVHSWNLLRAHKGPTSDSESSVRLCFNILRHPKAAPALAQQTWCNLLLSLYLLTCTCLCHIPLRGTLRHRGLLCQVSFHRLQIVGSFIPHEEHPSKCTTPNVCIHKCVA